MRSFAVAILCPVRPPMWGEGVAVRAYLADSSILIPFLRGEAHRRYVWRLLRQGRLLLSSVVALELLQGARDAEQRRRLRAFFQSFDRLALMSTPLHEDWLRAGDLISAYSRRQGEIDGR